MILAEQDDEQQVGPGYFRPESMTPIDATAAQAEVSPALLSPESTEADHLTA
jgi:hypothetical protein